MHSPLAGPCGCCGSGSAEWITLLGMLRTGERLSGQERCGKQPCRERSAGSSRGQGCHGAVGEPDLGLPPACICPRAERAPKARGTHSRPGRAENGGREGLPRQWEGCARMAHAMGVGKDRRKFAPWFPPSLASADRGPLSPLGAASRTRKVLRWHLLSPGCAQQPPPPPSPSQRFVPGCSQRCHKHAPLKQGDDEPYSHSNRITNYYGDKWEYQ